MATEAARLNKEQTHGKKKEKVCLYINRPSHGRTWRWTADFGGHWPAPMRFNETLPSWSESIYATELPSSIEVNLQ